MKLTRQHSRKVRQMWQECLVGGTPDPARIATAVERLLTRRERDAEVVLRGFAKTLKTYRRSHRIRITGAATPSPAQTAAILASLGEAARTVAGVEIAADPALITGLRVEQGYDVTDASLARQIERLRMQLAETHQ
jgi:F0F1-type ATP synthase delta subunit